MNETDKIIEVRHLSKSFSGKKVLEDINLYIRRGEFLTLLGPSGCGKTTMLRMIAGFLQPDEGSILLEGKELAGTPPHLRPLNTVFQRYALFPHLDVYDNIAFGLKLKKTPQEEIDKRVRRVDLKMRKDMQIELKEMHKKLGITFIYVTHDQEEALTLSDTIVVMNEGRIQQIGTPTDIYNEPVNSFVADFIGESNILNGTMICDRKVSFIGHDFDCVDEGFGEDNPVDVVVRPEDIYFVDKEKAQFSAKVKSCVFKGVHYEMFVDTDTGNELMIQDYDAFQPGTEVWLRIEPDDIQVMRKERTQNTFDGEVIDNETVRFLGGDFKCDASAYSSGDKVKVEVPFDKVDLLDNEEEGESYGNVIFILYKGDHYHLTIATPEGEKVWVDTNDIWDKNDQVGIHILPEDIHLRKAEGNE